MFFNPVSGLLRALLALAILVAAAFFIKDWYDELPRQTRVVDTARGTAVVMPLESPAERVRAWSEDPNRSLAPLVAGVLLLLLAFGAGRFVSPMLWRKGAPKRPWRSPSHIHALKTGNGYELHVEEYGEKESPSLVLVHGVGSDRTQWREAIEDLADLYRVFAFDLLGHGRSARDSGAEHTIEAAARDLDDVLGLAGVDGSVLVGHSMGGMIAMNWCATHPRRAARLGGLVLVHTTPRNPFATMKLAGFHLATQKWIHEPLLRMTPPLAPLVRLSHVLDYWNGTGHWMNDLEMFGGRETREQLDRAARLHATLDPAATARFTLAMTRFEARQKLPMFEVPTIVIAAEKDGVTKPEASREIAHRIPGAELITLDRTRHLGFMESRLQFAEVVSRFHPEHRERLPQPAMR